MELSFYTTHPSEVGSTAITKSGYDVSNTTTYKGMGIAASDPNVLPLYSIIHIDGLGKFIILDTGSYIKNNRLDILVESRQEAFQRGRYNETVRILRIGKG